MRLKKPQKGFTLIEMIIYLAIVSIVLVSITYLILDIMSGQTRTNAGEEVNYNSRFISQILTREIKVAQNIGSISSSSVTLTMPGDDIVYTFVPGDLTLTRQVGLAAAQIVNTSQVEVTGSFINNSYLARNKNISVNLMIDYKNPANLPDYNASTVADFSIELRGRR